MLISIRLRIVMAHLDIKMKLTEQIGMNMPKTSYRNTQNLMERDS